jgi:hypothetical protein
LQAPTFVSTSLPVSSAPVQPFASPQQQDAFQMLLSQMQQMQQQYQQQIHDINESNRKTIVQMQDAFYQLAAKVYNRPNTPISGASTVALPSQTFTTQPMSSQIPYPTSMESQKQSQSSSYAAPTAPVQQQQQQQPQQRQQQSSLRLSDRSTLSSDSVIDITGTSGSYYNVTHTHTAPCNIVNTQTITTQSSTIQSSTIPISQSTHPHQQQNVNLVPRMPCPLSTMGRGKPVKQSILDPPFASRQKTAKAIKEQATNAHPLKQTSITKFVSPVLHNNQAQRLRDQPSVKIQRIRHEAIVAKLTTATTVIESKRFAPWNCKSTDTEASAKRHLFYGTVDDDGKDVIVPTRYITNLLAGSLDVVTSYDELVMQFTNWKKLLLDEVLPKYTDHVYLYQELLELLIVSCARELDRNWFRDTKYVVTTSKEHNPWTLLYELYMIGYGYDFITNVHTLAAAFTALDQKVSLTDEYVDLIQYRWDDQITIGTVVAYHANHHFDTPSFMKLSPYHYDFAQYALPLKEFLHKLITDEILPVTDSFNKYVLASLINH